VGNSCFVCVSPWNVLETTRPIGLYGAGSCIYRIKNPIMSVQQKSWPHSSVARTASDARALLLVCQCYTCLLNTTLEGKQAISLKNFRARVYIIMNDITCGHWNSETLNCLSCTGPIADSPGRI